MASDQFIRFLQHSGHRQTKLDGHHPERAHDSAENIRLLDFGCGSGANLEFAARLGIGCVGIDVSAPALSFARRRLGPAGQNTLLFKRESTCDGVKKPDSWCEKLGALVSSDNGSSSTYAELGSFDLISSDGVLYYLPGEEVAELLKYFSQALRPGGSLRIYTKAPDDDLVLSATKQGEFDFLVNDGYERGTTIFVPEVGWYKDALKHLDVKCGFDRFSFTGAKTNSFYVITGKKV